MAEFVRARERGPGASVEPRTAPRPAVRPVPTAVGPILPFAAAAELLVEFGVPVARHVVVGPEVDVPSIAFDPPFAVKLADVPHRTDIGAVLLHVDAAGLPRAVEELRAKARAAGLPESVVVQEQLEAHGEAYVGAESDTDVGAIVLCGVGGTLLELLDERTARRAPVGADDAREMLDDLNPAVVAGFRGARPWDLDQLAALVAGISSLVLACREWLVSLDVNPLVLTSDGFVAVDALCVVRTESR
jgi:acetate---CoA ligase (ADP-forming)